MIQRDEIGTQLGLHDLIFGVPSRGQPMKPWQPMKEPYSGSERTQHEQARLLVGGGQDR